MINLSDDIGHGKTVEDHLKMDFLELLRHNNYNTAMEKDGTFCSKVIQNFWVMFQAGAKRAFGLKEYILNSKS